jgi:hypothetical protein
VATTPTPTPTPSATPSPTEATPSDTGAVATGTPPTGDVASALKAGGGIAWIAYTVGALLLLAGIATIGTILWRRGPQEVETEWAGYEAPPAAGSPPAPPDYGPPAPPPVDPFNTNIGMPPVNRPAGATYGSPTTYGTPRTGYDIPRQRD